MPSESLPLDIAAIDTSRYECVDGQLIERPGPARPHGKLQRYLANLIEAAAKDSGLEMEAEVSIDHRDEKNSDWLTPDLLVSEIGGFKQAQNEHVLPPVLLAIEILSAKQNFLNIRPKVSTLIGRGAKEVWLIDRVLTSVAVFRSPDTSKSEIVYEGTVFTADRSVAVELKEIFR